MLTHNLGYPRIGSKRELKKACEQFWAGTITQETLLQTGLQLRQQHWQAQATAGIDLIPSNDFSFYDHVLDTSLLFGVIPQRYHALIDGKSNKELAIYFAMARGFQQDGLDIVACEMTKWFDTNYHYLVPEFTKNQVFYRYSHKPIHEFEEAKQIGLHTKPVLLGPVSYLLLGKEKESGFHRIDLIHKLLPVYIDLLQELESRGATCIQLDEPFLVMDLSEKERLILLETYQKIRQACPALTILLATYFECSGDNLATTLALPVDVIHLDLVRCPSQLDDILAIESFIQSDKKLALGIVDGRNIWKNNFSKSLQLIEKAQAVLGASRLLLAPSCSLLHVPYDLDLEQDEQSLPTSIKNWMAFAKQKLGELHTLKHLANPANRRAYQDAWLENQAAMQAKEVSPLIHKTAVKAQLALVQAQDFSRNTPFATRQMLQKELLQLPLFPTTTIGSFPQTADLRLLRANYKKGLLTQDAYEQALENYISQAITWQENIGLDVLVHGEFERNDMVEYFGELLEGYAFTQHGWVQSYGSRCVKPPIIYGDIQRKGDMTVRWTQFAQAQTHKVVKGMLTGPITMLQWSFVRDDQARKQTALQLAWAIREEVLALEQAGIRIIQIDEPAIREGLPLRQANKAYYLDWAVNAFKLCASGVADTTQIHTHACYAEFNDIIASIAALDADVITIETSRSQMELLEAFADFAYPNEIGPGVYDIHSPRVPTIEEITALLTKALQHIPIQNLWVNPDCGLKTRHWEETEKALRNMVTATTQLRALYSIEQSL